MNLNLWINAPYKNTLTGSISQFIILVSEQKLITHTHHDEMYLNLHFINLILQSPETIVMYADITIV